MNAKLALAAPNAGYLPCSCVSAWLIESRPALRFDQRGQVRPHLLCAWLADVQPGADRTHGGHPPCRDLTRERLRSLCLQPMLARNVRCSPSERRARRCLAARMMTMSSS
jgi:hypothetical protein